MKEYWIYKLAFGFTNWGFFSAKIPSQLGLDLVDGGLIIRRFVKWCPLCCTSLFGFTSFAAYFVSVVTK